MSALVSASSSVGRPLAHVRDACSPAAARARHQPSCTQDLRRPELLHTVDLPDDYEPFEDSRRITQAKPKTELRAHRRRRRYKESLDDRREFVLALFQMATSRRSVWDTWRIRLAAEGRHQWKRYQRALAAQPVRTKALTSLFGLVLADMIAQAADPGAYDVSRTFRMGVFGVCWHGVSGHYWYEVLDRLVYPDQPKAGRTILAKMLADQLIWSPVNTVIFYASLAAMEGHTSDVPAILHDKLIATVVAGYCLWPVAHLVNFKFVPARNRLLYINVVNLFWSIYLARQASGASVLPGSDQPSALQYTPIPVSTNAPLPAAAARVA